MQTEEVKVAGIFDGIQGADIRPQELTRRKVISFGRMTYRQTHDTHWPRELHIEILTPDEVGPHPALLFFTGGSFVRAHTGNFQQLRTAFAQAGFVVASVEYSTIPHRFPAQIEDAKAAIAYLRTHARDFGVDPERISVLGDSAGGFIAQMLAVTSGTSTFLPDAVDPSQCEIAAAVSLYGVSYFLHPDADPANISSAAQGTDDNLVSLALAVVRGVEDPLPFAQALPAARQAAPISHIRADQPPLFLLHGGADDLVPIRLSIDMFEACQSIGAEVSLRIIPEAGHGDAYWYQPEVIDEIIAWVCQKLGYDPTFVPGRPVIS